MTPSTSPGRAPRLLTQTITVAAGAAVRLGDLDLATRLLGRKMIEEFVNWLVRLEPDLHPLVDRAPFAPRRAAVTLVWPLEADMIDAARFALFREVRIESGLPQASEAAAG